MSAAIFPIGRPCFVNTHPREMEDGQGLIDSLQKVREMTGNTDLVLEIHESSVTNPALMQSLHSAMRELEYLARLRRLRVRPG